MFMDHWSFIFYSPCAEIASRSHDAPYPVAWTLSLALGHRSLSEYQEGAQYLAGSEFPTAILEGLLKKVSLPSKSIGIVHLTPYDCHLERVSMKQLG